MAWLADYCRVEPTFLDALVRYGYLTLDGDRICFTWPGVPGVRKVRQAGTKTFFWQGDPAPPLWPEPGSPPEGSDGVLYLTEGETDALVLLALGLPAFATTKGASARPDLSVWTALRARGWKRIAILFDADAPGRQGAERLAADIRAAGLEAIPVDLAGAGLVDPLRGQKDLRDAWKSGRFQNLDAFRGHILGAVEGAVDSCMHHIRGSVHASSSRERRAADLQAEARTQGAGLTFLGFLGRPGYVVKGLSHLISAYAKVGKTTLLAQVVTEWPSERVLWVTEEPEAVWKARLAGLPDSYAHVTLYFAVGLDRASILERIVQGPETIVIIDTTYLLGIDDRNDASAVAEAILPLIGACRDAGKTLILVHHNRKGGGLHGEAIAGSHAFMALVDIALELLHDPHEARRRVIRGYGRVLAIPDLMIEMAPDGRLAPLGSPDAVTLRAVKERVRDLLTGKWATLKDLMAVMGEPRPSERQVRYALDALVEDGIAEVGKEGRAKVWRLRGSGPPDGPDQPPLGGQPILHARDDLIVHAGSDVTKVSPSDHPAPGDGSDPDGPDGPDGEGDWGDPDTDVIWDLEDTPTDPPSEGNPGDGDLPFLLDGASPEGPPWPLDTFEPALNADPTPCTACGQTIAAGMAVRSRLDPEGRPWHMNCAPVAADPDPPSWLPRCRACRTPMSLAVGRRQAVFACPACRRRVRLRKDDPRIRAVLERVAQDPDIAPWLETLGGEIVAVGPEGGP